MVLYSCLFKFWLPIVCLNWELVLMKKIGWVTVYNQINFINKKKKLYIWKTGLKHYIKHTHMRSWIFEWSTCSTPATLLKAKLFFPNIFQITLFRWYASFMLIWRGSWVTLKRLMLYFEEGDMVLWRGWWCHVDEGVVVLWRGCCDTLKRMKFFNNYISLVCDFFVDLSCSPNYIALFV